MRDMLLIITFCLLLTSAASAQQPTVTPDSQQASAQSSTAPVPVPEPSEKALSYYRSGVLLWIVNVIWGLLIPALFLFTGFSARIRDWATRIGRGGVFVIGVYFAIFLIINFAIDLPLSYYQGYVRQHAYGLSNQTFGKWFGDEIKGLLIGIVTGFLFLWIPYLLLKKSPRRWWLYTGLLAIPFLILMILVEPVWIDPLFNKFGPMNNKELGGRIFKSAEGAGIEAGAAMKLRRGENRKLSTASAAASAPLSV